MFSPQDAGLQRLGCFAREHGNTALEERRPFVIVLRNLMDSEAGFRLAGGQYGPVDMQTIHPRSAEFGQQCGVHIPDSAWEGLNPAQRNLF